MILCTEQAVIDGENQAEEFYERHYMGFSSMRMDIMMRQIWTAESTQPLRNAKAVPREGQFKYNSIKTGKKTENILKITELSNNQTIIEKNR